MPPTDGERVKYYIQRHASGYGGWFADDVEKTDHPDYGRKMHGAAARKTLAKISRLVTPEDA